MTSFPSKLLVLEPESQLPPVADALARAGHQVTRVSAAEQLLAPMREGSIAMLVVDLRHSDKASGALAACAPALAAARDDARPILVAVTADGAPLHVPAKTPPVHIDLWSGPLPALVARDLEGVLVARRLRDALAEVERLHETVRYARATAHDLAQPLTTILARAQLLMQRMKAEDTHYRPISIICQEAERLARIIEGFQSLKTMARQSAAQGH